MTTPTITELYEQLGGMMATWQQFLDQQMVWQAGPNADADLTPPNSDAKLKGYRIMSDSAGNKRTLMTPAQVQKIASDAVKMITDLNPQQLAIDLSAIRTDAAQVAASLDSARTELTSLRDQSESSKSAAATSATNAATSATSAETSATNAASSATTATTKANDAASSATAAATKASEASTSASTATTKASQAATSASEAAGSAATATTKASEAATSAATATTKASEASTSATNAATSATTAGTKASEASTSATSSAASATDSAASKTAAAASAAASAADAIVSKNWATAAIGTQVETGKYSAMHHASKAGEQATAASTSASVSTTKASEAATSASNAATSASNAATSASGAATSASTATTKANAASTSATAAASSATAASGSATSASNSATAAANSATAAASSATAAANSASQSEQYMLEAKNAMFVSTGALVEAGGISMAAGTYPAPLLDAKGNKLATFWKITEAGVAASDSVDYQIGDTLVYSVAMNGYYKIDNTESVTSVNGRKGAVVLTHTDVGALAATATAVAATKLATARTVYLTGGATGAGSFDGTANLSIAVTVGDDTHKHTFANLKSLPTTLAGYGITDAATATHTHADLLAKSGGALTGVVTINAAGAPSIGGASFGNGWLQIGQATGGIAIDTNEIVASGNDLLFGTITNNIVQFRINNIPVGEIRADGLYSAGSKVLTEASGNAVSASKLATARAVSLTGAATGSGSFDGTSNLSIAVTVADDGHKHTFSNLKELPTSLAGYGITDASHISHTHPDLLSRSGGVMTGALGVQTINGQGSSTSWASIDVTGVKGGYAGFNFPDTGHWFGVRTDGLAGIWDSAGTSKWHFNENGVLTGGAKILWDTIIDHPSRTNWASKAYVPAIVTGQLAWKNYGNGHTIFDASAGTSPDGTAVDKNNAQIAWRANDANYPTLMGWNGVNTYGVRVDSARLADSANWAAQADRATYLNGTVATAGQDLTIHGKRAVVGVGDANQLVLNYGNDWGSTLIVGHTWMNTVESNRHVVVHNGSTVYANSGLEVRSTDGSDVRIGFHRSGYSAGAINHNSWGFQFEREAGGGSRANVAAANFFADAAQDTSGNALTRKDYVDGALSSKFDKTGGTISGDVVINTSSLRGANGAAIVKDHGNGNTTFSGSRNAAAAVGDLYLGYHDNANHFTNKVILCKSMYSDVNHGLQIIDYSNGALFDKGAAVIGANRDNVLNNPSFGVGFLSAHDAGAQWIAGYFGKNGGSNQVVVGELNGGAVIGGHNAAKNAWAPIAINPGASGAETTYIGMFANQASGSGNLFVGNDVEANYMRLRSDIPNDSRYVVNRGYVDGNFIKRRTRLHPDDGTSLDNVQQEHGFNYSTGGGIFGPYISFGGLYGNYECQINADFISGNDIKFRTRNGDANRWNPWRTLWNSGNFDPGTKLDNGGYGDTLHLSNWFRSTGATGWYNETYCGGIWMDEASTVKVFNGKKFSVANNENNSISSTGGIFSYQRFMVDTRQQIGNGGSFNAYRSIDAPFHAGHGGLDAGTFAPIVGSANYTNGQGYTTRVHLGVRTVGADWTRAVLMVGSAESTSHPCATYEFDAYGNMTGITTVNAVNLVSSRTDGVTGLELRNTGGNPGLSFHRPGQSWAELRHNGGEYYMLGDGQNFRIGNDMICSYAYANGAQPQVANALTRKDYVDARDYAMRWENQLVPCHGGGDANAHYNSAWDGASVANAPSADWHFFRELYHSGGANWRHQEAFNFFSDEEWFRRGINASDYGPWRRRWHSGNFDPDSKLSNNGSGGTLTLNNWFRSTGNSGWYNETYQGGIYMEDATYVRVYNDKRFHVANATTDAISTAGGVTATGRVYAGTTVTGATGVFDGSARVYSANNRVPITNIDCSGMATSSNPYGFVTTGGEGAPQFTYASSIPTIFANYQGLDGSSKPNIGCIAIVNRITPAYTAAAAVAFGGSIAGSVLSLPNLGTLTGTWKILGALPAISSGTQSQTTSAPVLAIRIA